MGLRQPKFGTAGKAPRKARDATAGYGGAQGRCTARTPSFTLAAIMLPTMWVGPRPLNSLPLQVLQLTAPYVRQSELSSKMQSAEISGAMLRPSTSPELLNPTAQDIKTPKISSTIFESKTTLLIRLPASGDVALADGGSSLDAKREYREDEGESCEGGELHVGVFVVWDGWQGARRWIAASPRVPDNHLLRRRGYGEEGG
ncbi:hypothetical protein FB451DRAFT_1163875 [Mycena latifolia]|nr:hypothetical protein FB451DRAFT_1163875 [Mycena latifolia]